MKRVAIVGAGIAGLSTAYYLHTLSLREGRPLEVILLEKEERLGGSILTERAAGFIIEGGPDCFLSEKPWALQLCRELGLEHDVIGTNQQARRTFVLWGGLHELPEGFMLLAPTSLRPFARSSLFSFSGKLRMGLDLVIPRKRTDEDESLAAFVRRRLGTEALERIAEPLVAGIHAGDPETMSLQSTFPRFIDMERENHSLIWGMRQRRRRLSQHQPPYTMFVTMREGMGQIIAALEKALSSQTIALRHEVTEIEKITKPSLKKQRSQYRLHLSGTRKGLVVDTVILATPAFVTARLLRGLDSAISKHLYAIPYVSTATVNLVYRRSQIKHPLDGYGFVVPSLEGRKIMAATFSSIKFPGRAPGGMVLLRCFVGGAKNEELVSLRRTELLAAVRGDIEEILSINGAPFLIRVFRWDKAMPQYTLGHEERLSRIEKALSKHPGLFLTGSAYHGIGISDCVHQAELAAEQVLGFIRE